MSQIEMIVDQLRRSFDGETTTDTVAGAAMGIKGALRAAEVWRLLRWARRHFDRDRPDLVVGVDSPSMNFHFARAARQRGIPAMQYVAPQLWAWAEWRMTKVRRWVDVLACILPFEEAYFRAHGVNARFVPVHGGPGIVSGHRPDFAGPAWGE